MARKKAIATAFGGAHRYDEAAHVQRAVAGHLAAHIADLALPPNPRILEIGCGTGFLTAALREQGLSGDWLVTDLSAEMVARCRDALGADLHYAAMDGEQPALGGHARFDLVCSSLAFQWFHDLGAGLERLAHFVAPGGFLVFTTMAGGSFEEWRAAHHACGLDAAIPDYPDVPALSALAPPGFEMELFDFGITPRFADARAFLNHLRDIGAHVPRNGGRPPLPPGKLRRVMRSFEAAGAAATYHIACCTLHRQA